MKKFLIFVFLVVFSVGGYIAYSKISENIHEKNRIKEAKEGWYLEVITDEGLFVRKDHARKSDNIKDKKGNNLKLKKGEIYKITDAYTKDTQYYWYQIKLKDSSYGWVANPRNGGYIKDYNGELDVATPVLKYVNTYKTSKNLNEPDAYKALDIDHITTDHITVWDDRDDYVITWEVFHEVKKSDFIDQYWIEWKATDKSGKSSKIKRQKIVFENKPSEDRVKDFYTRK